MSPAGHRADAAEVCVVGAGPVGIKLAVDLAEQGVRVLLIEAGGRVSQPPPDTLASDIASSDRHHPLPETIRRGLGGTSAIWGGRCVPLDPVDFAARPFAAAARWPISYEDASEHFAESARFLNCGGGGFRAAPLEGGEPENMTFDSIERWCGEPNMGKLHAAKLDALATLQIMFNTTVLRADIDPATGEIGSLAALRDGKRITISARAYVLAAGGLESTRIMLATRATVPDAFGGQAGALGAYYMGHLSGSIARIVFTRSGDDRAFRYLRGADRRYSRRFMQLAPDMQLRHGLLNMAARPEMPELHDAAHGNGLLSLSYLGLKAPVIGKHLLQEPLRSRKLGPAGAPVLPHLANVLRNPVSSIVSGASFLKARFLEDGRMPALFFVNRCHTYQFWYHAEHSPSASSRVQLTSGDADGPAGIHIDLRYGEADARSVVETHRLMDKQLQASGIARIDYCAPEAERVGLVLSQARDGAHQIGTMRMSASPRDGVVDAECRVHGVANLYVAGSSVFPSSGQANPTFTAVALAVRLAQHIRRSLRALPDTPRARSTDAPATARRRAT